MAGDFRRGPGLSIGVGLGLGIEIGIGIGNLPKVQKIRVWIHVKHAMAFGQHVLPYTFDRAFRVPAVQAFVIVEDEHLEVTDKRFYIRQMLHVGYVEAVGYGHVVEISVEIC